MGENQGPREDGYQERRAVGEAGQGSYELRNDIRGNKHGLGQRQRAQVPEGRAAPLLHVSTNTHTLKSGNRKLCVQGHCKRD